MLKEWLAKLSGKKMVGIDIALRPEGSKHYSFGGPLDTVYVNFQCRTFFLNRWLGAPPYYTDHDKYVTNDTGRWWHQPTEHLYHIVRDAEVLEMLDGLGIHPKEEENDGADEPAVSRV